MKGGILSRALAGSRSFTIEDMCPIYFTPERAATAALLDYRKAVLDFHRDSKRARFARARDADPQRPGAL